MKLAEAFIEIVGKDETDQVFRSVEQKANGWASRLTAGISQNIGTLGKVATGAALGGLAALGGGLALLGTKAIAAGSDVQEMMAKFDVVFANTSSQVAGALDDFGQAAGRSKYELMEYAATLGDTLKPMGFAEDAAAGLSVDLVKLATDLSSFNNMPMDEALRRLQGTLIGSHENALAFGVVINENTLKAELAAMGADKLTGAQLEQAKVQARINLLMRGTTDAQGDAIRTADSWANQTRALQATMADLVAEIGGALLPIITPFLSKLGELASTIGPQVATVLQAVSEKIQLLMQVVNAEGLAGLFTTFEDGSTQLEGLFEAFGMTEGAARQLATGINDLVAKAQALLAPIVQAIMQFVSWQDVLVVVGGLIAATVVPAIVGIITAAAPLVATFAALVAAAAALRHAWENDFAGIRDFVQRLWDAVQDAVEGIKKLFAGDLEGALASFKDAFAGAKDAVVQFAGNILDELRDVAQRIGPVLAGWWQAFTGWVASQDWPAIGRQIIETVANALRTFAEYVLPVLASWWQAFASWVASVDWLQLGKNIITAILDGLRTFAEFIVPVLAQWFNAFADWVRSVDWQQLGSDIVTAIIEALRWMVTELPPMLARWARAFWDWISSVDWGGMGTSIIDGLVRGIQNAASAIWDALTGIAEGALGAIKGALGISSPSRAFAEVGAAIMAGLAVGIRGNADQPADAVADVASQISTDGAVAFADAMQAVANAMQPAMDAIMAVASFQMPGRFADTLIQLAENVRFMVRVIAGSAYVLQAESGGGALGLAKEISATLEAIAGAIDDAIGALFTIAEVQLPDPAAQMAQLAELMRQMVEHMASAASALSVEALAHVQVFADAAAEVAGLIEPAVAGLGALAAFAPGNLAQLITKAGQFATQITVLANKLYDAAQAMTEQAIEHVGAFASAARTVAELLEPAVAGLQLISAFAPGNLQQLIRNAGQFGTQIVVLANKLYDAAQAMSGQAVAHVQAFANAAKAVVDLIEPAVAGLAMIRAFEPGRLGTLSRNAQAFASQIVVLANKLAMAAAAINQQALAHAADIATGIQTITEAFVAILDNLQRIAEAVLPDIGGFVAWVHQAAQFIATVLLAANATVNGSVVAAAEAFAANMRAAVDAMLAALAALDELANADAPGGLQRILDAMVAAMSNKVQAGWRQVVQITQRGGQQMASTASSAAQLVVQAFTQLDWQAIGLAIADGIARGIQRGSWRIARAAQDAARRAYEAAQRELGIASPSKVAEQQIGLPFVEGIARGIERANDVRTAIAQLANAMPQMVVQQMPMFTAGAAPAGAGGSAGLPSTITIHINGRVEDETITIKQQGGVLNAARARGVR